MTSLKSYWDVAKKGMSPFLQLRIKTRVMAGTPIEKAIRSEGLIPPKTTADLSSAAELFKKGEWTVDSPESKEPKKQAESAPKGAPVGFIPRPKSTK